MPEQKIIKVYRINQLMFNIILFLILVLLFGWITALCGALLKVFGVQDVAYYIFIQKPLPPKWHRLKFTSLGFIRKCLTETEVLIQAITGIIICAGVLVFYLN